MLEVHTALKTLVEFYESAKKQNSKSSAILKHADTHTQSPPPTADFKKSQNHTGGKPPVHITSTAEHSFALMVQLMHGNRCPQPPST